MKIKFGSLVVAGRGKIGGHVASQNRSGAYLRTKVTPSNPSTGFQVAARALLAGLSSAWRSLTAAQRTAWNAAVGSYQRTNVFGDLVNPSGKNLYTRLNANLASIGVAAIATPPLPVAVVEPVTVITTLTALAFTLTPTNLDAGQDYQIWVTDPMSAGISNWGNRYRLLTTENGGTATPWDIHAAYLSRFGPRVAGQQIAVWIVPIESVTGQNGQGSEAAQLVA